MTTTTTLDALRAILPLAVAQAQQLRAIANAAQSVADDHVIDRADKATSAVTAAWLALAEAEEIRCAVRYCVTLRTALPWGVFGTHPVYVMAECADDAPAAAIAACEAAGLIVGDVLRVERVRA